MSAYHVGSFCWGGNFEPGCQFGRSLLKRALCNYIFTDGPIDKLLRKGDFPVQQLTCNISGLGVSDFFDLAMQENVTKWGPNFLKRQKSLAIQPTRLKEDEKSKIQSIKWNWYWGKRKCLQYPMVIFFPLSVSDVLSTTIFTENYSVNMG